MRENPLFNVGFMLVIVGIATVFLAVMALTLGQSKGRIRGGGVIMIGPIPIMFGTDSKTVKIMVVVATIFLIIFLTLFIINK